MPLEFVLNLSHPFRRKDLDYERQRLRTFQHGWTNSHVDVRDLAAAGFFYKGTTRAENTKSDLVECHFCGGQLHQWEVGDIPWIDHLTYFRRCPFIMGESTLNIPIYSTEDLNNHLEQQNQVTPRHLAIIESDLTVSPVSRYWARRGNRPLATINKDWKIEFVHGREDDETDSTPWFCEG